MLSVILSCHSDSNVFLVIIIVSFIFNLTISKVGDSLPKEMWEQLEKMEKRIELFAEEEEEEEVDNFHIHVSAAEPWEVFHQLSCVSYQDRVICDAYRFVAINFRFRCNTRSCWIKHLNLKCLDYVFCAS